MLTKDDLYAIEQIFDRKFDEKFGKKVKPIHKKLNKLQKDVNIIVSAFDSDIVDLKNKTEKLEGTVFRPHLV